MTTNVVFTTPADWRAILHLLVFAHRYHVHVSRGVQPHVVPITYLRDKAREDWARLAA